MRVGLDLRAGSASWLGGLYYLQNLALALSAADRPSERADTVALAPIEAGEATTREFEGIATVVPFWGGPVDRALRGRIEYRGKRILGSWRGAPVGIARAAEQAGVDVLFPTSDAGLKTRALAWIPDLQHLFLTEHFTESDRAARTASFAQTSASARLIVVSSKTAAAQLVEHFPAAADKVRVVHFRTVPRPHWNQLSPAAVVTRYELPDTYLLVANQFWAHKDHHTAFEAVRLLRERGVPVCLVCTGSTDDYRNPDHFRSLTRFVDENALGAAIRILGVVPRDDYVALLRGSAGVVQPSLFEGWSSIVEDARALGKPIALSDIPVHREQDSDRARVFTPRSPEELAERMAELLADPADDEDAALAAQHERVRVYAEEFISVARELLQNRY